MLRSWSEGLFVFFRNIEILFEFIIYIKILFEFITYIEISFICYFYKILDMAKKIAPRQKNLFIFSLARSQM